VISGDHWRHPRAGHVYRDCDRYPHDEGMKTVRLLPPSLRIVLLALALVAAAVGAGIVLANLSLAVTIIAGVGSIAVLTAVMLVVALVTTKHAESQEQRETHRLPIARA
jgi:hypothetical protein